MLLADINERDKNGNTALMRAAIMVPESEALAECKFLCDNGAQIDVTNDYGNTALMLAAMSGNHKTALFLIEQGGDPWRKNNDGVSAVDMTRKAMEFVNSFFAVQPMAA